MKKRGIVWMLIFSLLLLAGCGGKEAVPNQANQEEDIQTEPIVLNVFAAASLTDAMDEIKDIYEKNHNVVLQFNFASSGTLQKQIEEGATADYFISAGKSQMDALEEKGLIEERKDLLENRLVVVGTENLKGLINEMKDLAGEGIKYLALGTPETVPAGKYAKESLSHFELWDQLQEKMVFTKDVRQALTYVDTGNADVAFVYSSDALALEKGITLFEVPKESHAPINYPSAIIKNTENKEGVQQFADFLQSETGREILQKYGFIVK